VTTIVVAFVSLAKALQSGSGGKEGIVVLEEEVRHQIMRSKCLEIELRKHKLCDVSCGSAEDPHKLSLPRLVVNGETTEVKFAQGELGLLGEGGQFIGERQIRRVSLDPLNRLKGEFDRAVRRAIILAFTSRLDYLFGFTIVVSKHR
jgi:hypothetical protein